MSDSIPKRPRATREIIQACAEELALKIDCDAGTLVLYYSHPMDGYEFARELESYAGWDVKSQNADDLEDMQYLVDEKVKAAQKAWFAENDIQPPIPVGARARCSSRLRIGVIDGICEHGIGRYLLLPEDPTEHEKQTQCRWVINFEDAQPVD